jgi:hypothetical protein
MEGVWVTRPSTVHNFVSNVHTHSRESAISDHETEGVQRQEWWAEHKQKMTTLSEAFARLL